VTCCAKDRCRDRLDTSDRRVRRLLADGETKLVRKQTCKVWDPLAYRQSRLCFQIGIEDGGESLDNISARCIAGQPKMPAMLYDIALNVME